MATEPTRGIRIKRARERARLTQAQLADIISVSQKTIDNWEHDKTEPRSAIGALEHVLGVDLTGPYETLPDIVEQNKHDERVMTIWNDTGYHTATKLSIIRRMLEDDDGTQGLPPLVAGNSDLYQVMGIWNQPGFTRSERIHLIRNWLRLRHPERLGESGEAGEEHA